MVTPIIFNPKFQLWISGDWDCILYPNLNVHFGTRYHANHVKYVTERKEFVSDLLNSIHIRCESLYRGHSGSIIDNQLRHTFETNLYSLIRRAISNNRTYVADFIVMCDARNNTPSLIDNYGICIDLYFKFDSLFDMKGLRLIHDIYNIYPSIHMQRLA